jgi:hypothetical protein
MENKLSVVAVVEEKTLAVAAAVDPKPKPDDSAPVTGGASLSALDASTLEGASVLLSSFATVSEAGTEVGSSFVWAMSDMIILVACREYYSLQQEFQLEEANRHSGAGVYL